MQSKLATWSSEDKGRRFDRLFRLISSPEWLLEAASITLQSRGSMTPGIDGTTGNDIEENIDSFVNTVSRELRGGSYTPQPVKRVYIRKPNGKQRPLGIPTLRDRIVQRAMLMAMEPLWESDFHNLSYGFRPGRSVHQAIRTTKIQLQDTGQYSKGRWVIEGDLSSYFDTIHHRLLMKAVRKRVNDKRFLTLLWRFIKAGHVDRKIFCASHSGVPQGGVISPLLANIMLDEFDQYLEQRYLNRKTRKDRWSWNHTIKLERPIAVRERRQWKPAVSYCRYADDFLVIVKGTRAHAEAIREECRAFLEGKLRLTLNMEKTHITHVDDGFVFLGHRIIRKRGKKGVMRVTDSIPREKVRNFCAKLAEFIDSEQGMNRVDMIESLNRRLEGWARFYQYVDQKAWAFNKVDRTVFWKLAHWLGAKYKSRIKPLMKKWVTHPEPGKAKTWVLFGTSRQGNVCRAVLARLVGRGKRQFRWKQQDGNPYMREPGERSQAPTSMYRDVAMALSHC